MSGAGRRCDGAARVQLTLALLSAATLAAWAQAAPARAQSASPHWSVVSESQPTYFAPGDASDAFVLILRNDGGAATVRGVPIEVLDTLPSGVSATSVVAEGQAADGVGEPEYKMACPKPGGARTVTCTYGEEPEQAPVLPGAVIVMTIAVHVAEGVTALGPNTATVSEGGVLRASTSETATVSSTPAPFGLSLFGIDAVEESGEPDTQAGSHPFELTTTLAFTVAARESPSSSNAHAENPLAAAAPKDLEIALPPGLIGDPNATPRCSQPSFLEKERLDCPLDTQVGTIKPFFYGAFHPHAFPVYDVVPPPGVPAELGLSIGVGHVPLMLHVRDGEYRLTASLENIPEAGPLQGAILTLWGVPAASSHDLEREGTEGEGARASEVCKPSFALKEGKEEATSCPSGAPAKPFITLPSECQSSPLAAGVEYDSWEKPGPPLERFPGEALAAAAITGCERLSFTPSLALVPETTQAGSPSGYTLEVHVPQDEAPGVLATPDLRSALVTLPAGVVLSASVANGLQACSAAQFGEDSSAPAACPAQSQIGAVKLTTPLLPGPLEGELFVGQPQCAPCTAADAQEGRLARLLLQAQGEGVTVKLEGSASIEQATGQITVDFPQTPQLPWEELRVTLDGGQNGPLANSTSCGTPQTASARLTPYSSETPAQPSSEPFALEGCQPQFDPSFVAGTSDNRAGAYSPLTIALARTDSDEQLQALSVRLPSGLLGTLAKVRPCPLAQAQAGACGASSLIGTATIGAGPGADPLSLGGSVYLTGPYEGAPFGLSIDVPAQAGPFDLGQIVLGARIEVNPTTAALTIASDPLPQAIDGIPLQLKRVELDIDREGFVRNPTDCAPMAIEGALSSAAGATAVVTSRFQAAECADLPFKPKVTALTHAKAGKGRGVHLHVRIVLAPGGANIAKLKIDLPKSMVPPLSTLQKACPRTTFEANPASCPAASVAGSATALTPIFRQPLSGPVYVVSSGRVAEPEVALALQSEGVVIEAVGQASVKGGVASVAFRSLPDAPISELDVLLEAGPHSLLAPNLPASAHGSMCARRLAMPSELTAQNGAVVKQTTLIEVSGCRKTARTTRKDSTRASGSEHEARRERER